MWITRYDTARPLNAVRACSSVAHPAQSHLLCTLISGELAPYWEQNTAARRAYEAVESAYPTQPVAIDHMAFRTFGLEALGIASAASVFEDLGYEARGELTFPAKKLFARWFAPPEVSLEPWPNVGAPLKTN